MSWSVYILECADQTLYTGIATDVVARIACHERGEGAKYTRGRGPLRLVYREEHPDRATASRREVQIKALSRAQKLDLLKSYKAA